MSPHPIKNIRFQSGKFPHLLIKMFQFCCHRDDYKSLGWSSLKQWSITNQPSKHPPVLLLMKSAKSAHIHVMLHIAEMYNANLNLNPGSITCRVSHVEFPLGVPAPLTINNIYILVYFTCQSRHWLRAGVGPHWDLYFGWIKCREWIYCN